MSRRRPTIAECLAAAVLIEQVTDARAEQLTDPESAFLAGFAAGVRMATGERPDITTPEQP